MKVVTDGQTESRTDILFGDTYFHDVLTLFDDASMKKNFFDRVEKVIAIVTGLASTKNQLKGVLIYLVL